MKKIAIYPNGSYGLVDIDSTHSIKINGQDPLEFFDVTPENLQKYFGKDFKLEAPQDVKI